MLIVISAVSGSPGASGWAWEMLRTDRNGFLCEEELKELAEPIRVQPGNAT